MTMMSHWVETGDGQLVSSVAVLPAGVSRRLIGRGVAALPLVRERIQTGRMVIVGGGTTRHVVQALLDEDPGREAFAVGWIRDGVLGETPKEGRGPGPYLFESGQVSRGWPGDLLARFGVGDVYIKGANAIDPAGNVGVLMASPTGGTIGAALTILMARGGVLIVPVSMQKLIPSVSAACSIMGQGRAVRVMGSPVGCMPILSGAAQVITEVEAITILSEGHIKATPVAAGGVDDCEGALVVVLEGPLQAVDKMMDLLESWRNELLVSTEDPA